MDTGGVETGSSGAGVEAEDASSDEGIVTCEVEAGSSGATVEMDDASWIKDEFVKKACSLGMGIAAVVADGVDEEVRTGTDEVLDTAKGLALYAFHLWW